MIGTSKFPSPGFHGHFLVKGITSDHFYFLIVNLFVSSSFKSQTLLLFSYEPSARECELSYEKIKQERIPMERLDTSDPNSPPHLGKVQITHPLEHGRQSNALREMLKLRIDRCITSVVQLTTIAAPSHSPLKTPSNSAGT